MKALLLLLLIFLVLPMRKPHPQIEVWWTQAPGLTYTVLYGTDEPTNALFFGATNYGIITTNLLPGRRYTVRLICTDRGSNSLPTASAWGVPGTGQIRRAETREIK